MSPADEAAAAARVARLAYSVRNLQLAEREAAAARSQVRIAARAAKKHGVSIAEIARVAGVTRHTIYDWLRPAASTRGEA